MEWDLLGKQQAAEAKKNGREVRWVVTGVSESSDHYGPYILSKKPTSDQLKRIALGCDSNDELDGPGDFGSYIYLKIAQCVVDSILTEV